MGLLWHRVERNEIAAGDHIYTWRSFYAYSHHGIYVGENKVVHFTPDQNMGSTKHSSFTFSASVSSILPTTCPNLPDCGFRKPESGVILSCLDCFLSSGSIRRFEYGVSKAIWIAKRGGTCTPAHSDPPQEVIHRAMSLLQNGFGNYSVLRNNCEDFAFYCKTGLLIINPGSSGQAGSAFQASKAAIYSAPLKLFISSHIGMMAVTAGIYCLNRLKNDIGVRTDVAEVSVENIGILHAFDYQRVIKEQGSPHATGFFCCALVVEEKESLLSSLLP